MKKALEHISGSFLKKTSTFMMLCFAGLLLQTMAGNAHTRFISANKTLFADIGSKLRYNMAEEAGGDRLIWRDQDTPPNPSRAALYSAILPGAGQAYNRSYFKIPVIYLAGAGLYYGYSFNNRHYTDLRDAYRQRTDESITEPDDYHPDSDSDNPKYTTEQQLISAREFYRRNRDLFVISLGLLYILNITDAFVDAHLYAFDVSEDLTLKINYGYLHTDIRNPEMKPALNLRLNF